MRLSGDDERPGAAPNGFTCLRRASLSGFTGRRGAHGRELSRRTAAVSTIRNEQANALYTTDFLARLFEEEGGQLFDAPGGAGPYSAGATPRHLTASSPTRLAAHGIDFLTTELERGTAAGVFMGLTEAN